MLIDSKTDQDIEEHPERKVYCSPQFSSILSPLDDWGRLPARKRNTVTRCVQRVTKQGKRGEKRWAEIQTMCRVRVYKELLAALEKTMIECDRGRERRRERKNATIFSCDSSGGSTGDEVHDRLW